VLFRAQFPACLTFREPYDLRIRTFNKILILVV